MTTAWIRTGRALEAVGLFWLEEPVAYDDVAGHARIAAALDTPIASGETEYGLLGMRRYLEARAADVLMPDLQRMGGITGLVKAAALCEAHHTPVSPHLFMESSAHVVSALSNGLIQEHMDWWESLFVERLVVVDGHLELPDRPGLGLTLDRAAVDRYRA